MLLQIRDNSGRILFSTEYFEALPEADWIKLMDSSNYSFTLDGKDISATRLIKFIKENKIDLSNFVSDEEKRKKYEEN